MIFHPKLLQLLECLFHPVKGSFFSIFCSYLCVFEYLASNVPRFPLDRVGPDGFAPNTEETDNDVCDGDVEDHGAERGPVAVLGNGNDGQYVEDQG